MNVSKNKFGSKGAQFILLAITNENCTVQNLVLKNIEMKSIIGMPYYGDYKVYTVQEICFDGN